jgi:hypothetical protein
MAATTPMTYEELMDNYEFKVSKKMLMREYPWIKDVTYKKPEDINKYNLIFIDIVVDPYELAEEYGWNVIWYINRRVRDGDFPNYAYLSIMFDGPESTEGAKNIQNQLERDLLSIHRSAAIPQELKLPEDRRLVIGGVYVDPNSKPPQQSPSYPPYPLTT